MSALNCVSIFFVCVCVCMLARAMGVGERRDGKAVSSKACLSPVLVW